jgi:hypothetical protein
MVIDLINFNSTLPNIRNVTFINTPPKVTQPPPPWYVQYIPDFIIMAGILSTVLTFYFSPELRNGFKTLINKYHK